MGGFKHDGPGVCTCAYCFRWVDDFDSGGWDFSREGNQVASWKNYYSTLWNYQKDSDVQFNDAFERDGFFQAKESGYGTHIYGVQLPWQRDYDRTVFPAHEAMAWKTEIRCKVKKGSLSFDLESSRPSGLYDPRPEICLTLHKDNGKVYITSANHYGSYPQAMWPYWNRTLYTSPGYVTNGVDFDLNDFVKVEISWTPFRLFRERVKLYVEGCMRVVDIKVTNETSGDTYTYKCIAHSETRRYFPWFTAKPRFESWWPLSTESSDDRTYYAIEGPRGEDVRIESEYLIDYYHVAPLKVFKYDNQTTLYDVVWNGYMTSSFDGCETVSDILYEGIKYGNSWYDGYRYNAQLKFTGGIDETLEAVANFTGGHQHVWILNENWNLTKFLPVYPTIYTGKITKVYAAVLSPNHFLVEMTWVRDSDGASGDVYWIYPLGENVETCEFPINVNVSSAIAAGARLPALNGDFVAQDLWNAFAGTGHTLTLNKNPI